MASPLSETMHGHVARFALVRYGLAVLCVTASVAVALWVRPFVLAAGQLSLVAIVIVGWVCGLRPALLACGLATLAFAYFFTPPLDSLAVDLAEAPRFLMFAVLGLLMATMSAARRSAEDSLRRAGEELESRVRERTADLEQSNDRLRDREAKLEQAQRIAHVGYWDRDLETDRVEWSSETYRILGLTPQACELTPATLWQLIHPEDRPSVAAAMAEVRAGGPRYEAEYRVLRPGG